MAPGSRARPGGALPALLATLLLCLLSAPPCLPTSVPATSGGARWGLHAALDRVSHYWAVGKSRILSLRGGATAAKAPPAQEPAPTDAEPGAGRKRGGLFWPLCSQDKSSPTDHWWPKALLGPKGELLGVGRFSEVYHTTLVEGGRDVALKIMKARPSDLVLHKRINREIEILNEVGEHFGIVKLLDTFRTEDRVGLIFERCYGGELFGILENTIINDRGERMFLNRTKNAAHKSIELSERSIATLLGQVLDVVNYLHTRGIVHRDLKLENVLLEKPFGSKEEGALKCKLIDFGLSKRLSDEGGMFSACGSAYYAAPEVMNAVKTGTPYSTPCDLWALGVMSYCLLCRQYPFDGDDTKEVLAAVQNAKFSFPESVKISDDAKDFVTRCLVLNPEKRITVEGALEHRWIKNLRMSKF